MVMFPPLFSAALLRALFVDVSAKLTSPSTALSASDESGDAEVVAIDTDALSSVQTLSAAGAGDPGAAAPTAGGAIQVRRALSHAHGFVSRPFEPLSVSIHFKRCVHLCGHVGHDVSAR
jgi:hypothetical protein